MTDGVAVVTPQARDDFGLGPRYWFWLVAASTLFILVFIVYIKKVFFDFAGIVDT